jgi:hypothetical protein
MQSFLGPFASKQSYRNRYNIIDCGQKANFYVFRKKVLDKKGNHVLHQAAENIRRKV